MSNEFETEQTMLQVKRRRGNMLKFVRQGHAKQLERMNDSLMGRMMANIGSNMSPNQVMTMLQDLRVIGYLSFDQRFCPVRERMVIEDIMLTAAGLAVTSRRQDTEEVIFD